MMKCKSLNDPNTHIFVEGRQGYLYGSTGFKCKNLSCRGFYLLNNINGQPDICIYCSLKKALIYY